MGVLIKLAFPDEIAQDMLQRTHENTLFDREKLGEHEHMLSTKKQGNFCEIISFPKTIRPTLESKLLILECVTHHKTNLFLLDKRGRCSLTEY